MLERYYQRPHILARLRANVLGKNLDDFVAHLDKLEYSPLTVKAYVQSVEHFGQWLRLKNIPPSAVTEDTIYSFLYTHLPKCRCPKPSRKYSPTVKAALNHLPQVLQDRYGPRSSPKTKQTYIDRTIHSFKVYLQETCGLAARTWPNRVYYVREFLNFKYGTGPVRLTNLKAGDLMEFVSNRAKRYKPATIKSIATSLRSYLRFLQLRGLSDGSLIGAIPRIAQWKLSSLPKTLTDQQVKKFLAAFDRSTSTGQRDYAMALCLAKLGLRACGVARLRLDDINWRKATLRVTGKKSRRANVLPLPKNVGKAIAAYLRSGRPKTSEPTLFVRHIAPAGIPIGSCLVRTAMRRAAERARLPPDCRGGTHILRHTAATRMHQNGASLKEIADVLGHQSIDTTAVYAKVNLSMLATVALPWPEGQS